MGHSSSLIKRLSLCLAATLPAAACSSPTDGTPPLAEATLAFTMDSSIYVVSTKAGATPSLLVSPFSKPSWSPDGGTLAMVAAADPEHGALYLADADGGNVRELTVFSAGILSAALWSPDGTSLLFVRSGRSFPSYDSVAHVAVTGEPETAIDTLTSGTAVSLSHDGSLVTVEALTVLGRSFSVIDIASRDTVLQMVGTSPRFSPASDEIAFREPTTGHIHLIRSDSSAERDVQVDGYPKTWSPDGGRLAFVGIDGAVYTINVDGSGLSRIGPLNVSVSDLAWSADGQEIAYYATTSFGPGTIYVARPDDSGARPILTALGVCCLAWRP